MNAGNWLAMLSDSESELFITQSSFSGSTSMELSKNNFESLFAGADNEKAVDNFNSRTEEIVSDVLQGSATDFSRASVESNEPSTKKIRERAPKENTAQFNFRNCSVVFSISK